jgi:1,4-alpha-glucan branching enzyme
LETEENGIDAFTSSYTHYGIHVDCRTNEIKIKEWAPNARAMYIRGEFSLYSK